MGSKSNYRSNDRKSIKPKPRVKSPKKDVQVRILKPGIYKVTGTVTGKFYVFSGAGSTQSVDERDIEYFKNKVFGEACCGTGLGGQKVFEILT